MNELKQFAEWLADSVLDEEWNKEHDAYTELICRKLVNLGFLIKEDNMYMKKDGD